MKLFLTLCLLLLLPGCGLIKIHTNLRVFGDHVEIINNSRYNLEVAVDGRPAGFSQREGNWLPPTESDVTSFFNFSSRGYESNISIKAWEGDRLVGAAATKVSVSGNYLQAKTWIVTDDTFRQPYHYLQ